MRKTVTLIVWILSFQLVSGFMGTISRAHIANWYPTLTHPPFMPHNLVFPLMWGLLYVVIAIAGWALWEGKPFPQQVRAKHFFLIQLLFNWAWTPLFFYFHLTGAAFICVNGIIIFTLLTILATWRDARMVSVLLTPYGLWLLFASYLNGTIWYLN